jgi:PAN domain
MIRVAAALVSVVAALICGTPTAIAQVGYDRRGADYLSFQVRSGDPAVCAGRCERDARCRAWSFNYPTAERVAVCWLKSQVPPRTEDSGSVSGVRGTGVILPRTVAREFSIDRVGGDFRNFEMAPDPSGEVCRGACETDLRCRAWTYARPGYSGPNARCFLKDRITPPRHRACCISGVVR